MATNKLNTSSTVRFLMSWISMKKHWNGDAVFEAVCMPFIHRFYSWIWFFCYFAQQIQSVYAREYKSLEDEPQFRAGYQQRILKSESECHILFCHDWKFIFIALTWPLISCAVATY